MAGLFHRRAKPSGAAPDDASYRSYRGGPRQQPGSAEDASYRRGRQQSSVAETSHPRDDLSTHPDADEMRTRYNRILGGHDVALMDAPVYLIGLLCAVSPWIVHFTTTQPALVIHNVIIGIAIALLGWGFANAPHRMYGLSWAMPVIGTWLIISSWLVGTHPDRGVIALNATLGGLTILMGLLCAAVAAKARGRRARAPSARAPAG
jgi:SPW repeat-containing protein